MAERDPGYTVPGRNDDAYRAAKGANGGQLLTQLPVNTLRLWTTYRLRGDWSGLTFEGRGQLELEDLAVFQSL